MLDPAMSERRVLTPHMLDLREKPARGRRSAPSELLVCIPKGVTLAKTVMGLFNPVPVEDQLDWLLRPADPTGSCRCVG